MVSLSEEGKADACRAGRSLRGIVFDRVYCSDSLRAIETMKIALPDFEAELSSDLREINVGDCCGMTFNECAEKYGDVYKQILAGNDFSPVGGESHSMHFNRVRHFMKQLEQGKGCKNIAIFCHEGTIKCMLTYIVGVMISPSVLRIDNGAVCIFRYVGKGWALHQWNLTD